MLTVLLWALLAMAAVAAVYQLLTVAAGLHHLRQPVPAEPPLLPPISILKPVRGLDDRLAEALESLARQDYPDFEILFAVAEEGDPAEALLTQLQQKYPQRIRAIVRAEINLPNRKVAKLRALEGIAQHPIILISDADIRVPPGYLRAVAAKLAEPGVGLVTALYRARASTLAGRWEALGISTDFSPSALVGRMLGVSEFALGSTMALRRDLLDAVGGCAALGNYIADDYHLGRLVREKGFHIALLREPVETSLSGHTWGEVWQHQLRWARTIRASRPDGYAGLPVTSASLWALLLLATPWWYAGLALLALRMAAGAWLARVVLQDKLPAGMLLLQPLRDLWAFAIWACGLFGRTVEWRGQRLVLNPRGVIVAERPATPRTS